MDDEYNPQKKGNANHLLGSDLSTLSVSDIEDVITELESEILRLKNEKTNKSASIDVADSFFKKPS